MVPFIDVTLGGRVVNAEGQGIRNVSVTVSGGDLASPITVRTGSLGTYRVSGLKSATQYTVTVAANRFTFAEPSRNVTMVSSLSAFNFTAQ
jgi:hypothetical protein